MNTCLSVNSDDFGLSPAINRGIMVAYNQGILTDASLMANGPAFDQAVALCRGTGLGIAAHVNLVRGPMLTPMDTPGSVTRLWRRFALQARFRLAVEKEVRAQVEKIAACGLKIGQINGEKHGHFFPPLFALFVRVAEAYRLPYIRFIREWNLRPALQGLKANLLSAFSLANGRALAHSSLSCARYFTGILATGRLDNELLARMLRRLRPGWTECMVHVGYQGEIDPVMGRYFLASTRELELNALVHPAITRLVKENGIMLKSFGRNA